MDFFPKNSAQLSAPNHSLEERLNKHPQLKRSNEALLNVVENTENNLENANLAEQKVIEEVRQIGPEVLEDWAHEPSRPNRQRISVHTSCREKTWQKKTPLAQYCKKNRIKRTTFFTRWS